MSKWHVKDVSLNLSIVKIMNLSLLRSIWGDALDVLQLQRGTTLRYRCQVVWPSTGSTMIRPRNNGIDPTTRPAATTNPHKAIGTGFTVTARTDVHTAAPSPTSRSSNSGKDTTLISSTSRAKRNPMPIPTAIIAQPAPVEKMSLTKAPKEAGGSGPRVTS